MANKEILRMIAGFRRFREKYFSDENSFYGRLTATGQTPKVLIVGCSDSRVDPALISSASPGELFVIRNVANLVPPFDSSGSGQHGVSAAIEFAVLNLKVETIIVLGHRQCGGIRALMSGDVQQGSFVSRWMQIADRAKQEVIARHQGADQDTLCRHCELESITVSLENLKTFPFVREAVEQGRLEVHGIYFDIESGGLMQFDPEAKSFRNINVPDRQPAKD